MADFHPHIPFIFLLFLTCLVLINPRSLAIPVLSFQDELDFTPAFPRGLNDSSDDVAGTVEARAAADYTPCGRGSLNGAGVCPMNLCCSQSGYCGTTADYCSPCQVGFGGCKIVPDPVCDSNSGIVQKRTVAYFQAAAFRYRPCDTKPLSQLNVAGLTHLVFAFVSIDPETFAVVPADPADVDTYKPFTALKSTALQTWLAIGGGAFSDPGSPTLTTWSDMVSTSANRAAFISSLVAFMKQYGFQGVDLDWEFPVTASRGGRPGDRANLLQLVKEMKATFATVTVGDDGDGDGDGSDGAVDAAAAAHPGLSVVLPPDITYLPNYDIVAMSPYVDFFGFMSYDLHGINDPDNIVRPHADIRDIQKAMQPLWFAGVDPKKINMGLPYYGRTFVLTDPNCKDAFVCTHSGLGAVGPCTNWAGMLSNAEIRRLVAANPNNVKLLNGAMMKQLVYNGNQWVGYDDWDTMAAKRAWANGKCLSGTMIWTLDFDP